MEGNIDLIKNGKRLDGRDYDEIRPLKILAGVLKRADGSAYIEWGGNKILAAVYGPRDVRPRHLRRATKAIVQCKYNMASFSVANRKRPGPDKRSNEISKVMSEAFEEVVLTERFPRSTIDVFIEVLQAHAGTRCAALTAASVALANAGIPMKDLLPACAVGKADGQLLVDPNKEEDNFGQADLPVAIMPRTGEIVLLQMDGHLTREEFNAALEMAKNACMSIYDIQKKALKESLVSEFSLKSMDVDEMMPIKIVNGWAEETGETEEIEETEGTEETDSEETEGTEETEEDGMIIFEEYESDSDTDEGNSEIDSSSIIEFSVSDEMVSDRESASDTGRDIAKEEGGE